MATTATTITSKTRTITLTDRPPVKITEEDWPVIATGLADDDDDHGRGNLPNREWTREIRVRRHEDGRAIVYGIYDYTTCFQGEAGAYARRGELLPLPVTYGEIIAAIRAVGAALAEAESDAALDDNRKDSRQWRAAVQECIADLPAEVL